MMTHVRRFWHDEDGPELVEWALIALIIFGAGVVGIVHFRNELVGVLQDTFTQLQKSPDTTY
jgi:Flp pilus assembly pilin Flp